MFLRLLALFIILPLVELYILFLIADKIGGLETIAIVVGTGLLGAALAKWQGVRTIASVRGKLSQGHMPTAALLDGLLIVLAAVLLATPGVITDCFGFSLLIPKCRSWYRGGLSKWLKSKFRFERFGGEGSTGHTGGDRILEGYIVESDAESQDSK